MTTQQLVEDLDRRNREAKQLFDIAMGNGSTIAADAAASGAVAPAESPFAAAAKALAQNVAVQPSAPAPAVAPVQSAAPAVQAPVVAGPEGSSFYDMLLRNDAVRLRNQEAFDRREKADSARLRLAAVTDALASLGNLVGTTQGAFSQPQTYQVPFVYEDMEKNREKARQYADYLNRTDQSLRLTKAKQDYENSLYGNRLALEQAKTDRALALALERANLASQNNEAKKELEGTKHGYRSEEETQKQEGRRELQQMRNEQSDINNRRSTGTSAANSIRTDTRIREMGGSGSGGGGVSGYTTETTITRNEYGQETGRTTVRTPAGGKPSTTTTSKTPPSKQKKEQGASKTPPSKRKK